MEDSVNEAVKKFDDKPVDDLICRVKPYFTDKSQKRNQQGDLLRRVYLMNIPYDTYPKEIEQLVQEFAPIDQVVMPRDHGGMTRGYAFVYLKNAADVQKVIDYVDGRHIRSRQIRAKKSLVDPSKQQK